MAITSKSPLCNKANVVACIWRAHKIGVAGDSGPGGDSQDSTQHPRAAASRAHREQELPLSRCTDKIIATQDHRGKTVRYLCRLLPTRTTERTFTPAMPSASQHGTKKERC